MRFLYNHMRRAKEEIIYNEDNDQKMWDNKCIIVYMLQDIINPHFHYDDDVLKDRRIKAGLMECLDIMVPTVEERCPPTWLRS
ncbi:hypothetical protein EJ110_NYTH20255 [Nymphaea thermarum]|nr:hypothetical protein EJ110_NYTH20255 [Nymphaea thermarum]